MEGETTWGKGEGKIENGGSYWINAKGICSTKDTINGGIKLKHRILLEKIFSVEKGKEASALISKQSRTDMTKSMYSWHSYKRVNIQWCYSAISISFIDSSFSKPPEAISQIFCYPLPLQASHHLRPVGFLKHWPDTPGWAKHIEWLWETVIIDQASINGERTHQQYNVAATENNVEYLSKLGKEIRGMEREDK